MLKYLLMFMVVMIFACGPYRVNTVKSPIQKNEKITMTALVLKNLNLVSLTSEQTDSGRLKVILEMQNEKRKDIWTDIQIAFLNANNTEIERTEWESFNWEQKAVKTYVKSALNPDAVDYRISIRKVK